MDVSLGILWGLNLDNQVDRGDVKSTGSDISSNQHAKLLFLEALQSHFSLVLGDIAMHDLDVLLNLVGQQKLVSFLLGRCKHDSLSTSVANEHISQSGGSVVVRHINGQMSDSPGSLVLQVLDQIERDVSRVQEHAANLLDPTGNSSGEHKTLEVLGTSLFNSSHNFLNIFLKTKVEHNVCLIETGHSKVREIKVSSFHVVLDSAGGTHEDVHAASKVPGLVVNGDTSIDCQNFIFFVMLFERV